MPDELNGLSPAFHNSAVARLHHELGRIKDEPRMLILVSSGFLELLVNVVIDAKCKNAKKINENSRDYPFSTKLVLLNEMGLMSDSSFWNIK
ncbi:MAG: hypothetical protein K8U57_14945 [Planctomycetes bacterium]|nr:hypothetical protein [Planctomycetota bacterium]